MLSKHNEIKLEINSRQVKEKSPNTDTKQHTSKYPWVKEEVSREKKCIKLKENGNIMYQNLWDTAKDNEKIYRSKCIVEKRKSFNLFI